MSKLGKLLRENKMTLVVEVPKNNLAMIDAIVAAGADALQLTAAGAKAELEKILDKMELPVGIAVGAAVFKEEKKLKELLGLGFDFVNLGVDALEEHAAKFKGVAKVLALDSKFSIEKLIGISSLKGEALDAAILPTEAWGKELVVGDLQNYISIILSANIPVIIPTQRAIRVSEVAIIADTGAKGILLTETVIGSSPDQVGKVVREFRLAIDELE